MYNGVQSSLFLARKRQKYEEFMKIHNAAVAQR